MPIRSCIGPRIIPNSWDDLKDKRVSDFCLPAPLREALQAGTRNAKHSFLLASFVLSDIM